MWEWLSNHEQDGHGLVLYMDGHVELIKYPGEFPMTETLRQMKPQISGDCPPIASK
jgi:hypothetical protein